MAIGNAASGGVAPSAGAGWEYDRGTVAAQPRVLLLAKARPRHVVSADSDQKNAREVLGERGGRSPVGSLPGGRSRSPSRVCTVRVEDSGQNRLLSPTEKPTRWPPAQQCGFENRSPEAGRPASWQSVVTARPPA